jgi:hypothetical protein
MMDLQHGRGAALVANVLEGRVAASPQVIQDLGLHATEGVAGALDALYRIAWQEGSLGAEAHEVMKRLGQNKDGPHQGTLQLMLHLLRRKYR